MTDSTFSPIVTRLSEVTPRRIEWLWPGRIAFGKVTVIEGRPGVGKSTVLLDLAARVSRGDAMPGGSHELEAPAGVLITAATEDSTADTIVPRLMAARADLTRVHEVSGKVAPDGEHQPITLDDIDVIRDVIVTHGIRYVLADAFMALIPAGVDSGRDPAMRRVLHPLADLADETGVAIVANRHHKKGGGPAIEKGGESTAIGAVARSVLVAGVDPHDEHGERMVLATVKENLTAPGDRPAWSYRIASTPVNLGDGGPPVDIGRVEWLGPSDATADQVANGPADHEEMSDTDECVGIIRGLLADGPRPGREVKSECRKDGFTDRVVRRARERLEVVTRREGFGSDGRSMWRLPSPLRDHAGPPPRGSRMDTHGDSPSTSGKTCNGCGEPWHGIGSICEGCL